MQQQRFEVLDSFRGIFAISVVLFHLHITNSITDFSFFKGSGIFVEFFFVLSGFVLTHTYAFRKHLTFKQFAISRSFRLLPLHLVMLIVFILFECGKYAGENFGLEFNAPAFSGADAVTQILPNALLIQSWAPFSETFSFNYPAWSISVEFYTYFLFFGMLVFFRSNKTVVWGLTLSMMMFVSLVATDAAVKDVYSGISSFFAGALSYHVFRATRDKLQFNYFISSILEAISIICVVYLVSHLIDFQYYAQIALILFSASIIVFAQEGGAFSRFFRQRYFITIGKLSYSIYMVHAAVIFVITSVAIILQKVLGIELAPMQNEERYIDFGSTVINNIAVLLILALVVVISHFTYRYIELKGQRVGKYLLKKQEKEQLSPMVRHKQGHA